MELRAFDANGDKLPLVAVGDVVSGVDDSASLGLVHDACVMYHANRRVGTAKTKSRGEVSGSTRKLYKQKGTGNARAGQKRTPTRRGGGHCFAKTPRDWSYQLPRKAKRKALQLAVKLKLAAGEVSVAQLPLQLQKTKAVAAFLERAIPGAASYLLVTKSNEAVLVKAARNIPNVTICQFRNLNADLVMRHRQIMVDASSVDVLFESAV